jgi:chemotaxis signal transduction protein
VTVHLRAAAGGHELLLDSASVRRVSAVGDAAGGDLPFLDLSLLLGGETSGNAVVVYAAGDSDAIALAVDEVKGLVTLGPNALRRLPAISERFAQLFDAITVEAIDGRHALCLRSRLDIRAIERLDG